MGDLVSMEKEGSGFLNGRELGPGLKYWWVSSRWIYSTIAAVTYNTQILV